MQPPFFFIIWSVLVLALFDSLVKAQPGNYTTNTCNNTLTFKTPSLCSTSLPSTTEATWIVVKVTAQVPGGYQLSINVTSPSPEVLNAPVDVLTDSNFYTFALSSEHGANQFSLQTSLVKLDPVLLDNVSATYNIIVDVHVALELNITTTGTYNLGHNEEVLVKEFPFAGYTANLPTPQLPAVVSVVSQVVSSSPTNTRFAPIRLSRDRFVNDSESDCVSSCSSDLNKFKVGAVAAFLPLNAPSDIGKIYVGIGNREAESYPNIASAPYFYNLAATILSPIPMPDPLPFENFTYIETVFHAPVVFAINITAWAENLSLTYPSWITVTLESQGAEMFIAKDVIPTEELHLPSTTRPSLVKVGDRDPTLTRPTSVITENIILSSNADFGVYYVTIVPYSFTPDGPSKDANSYIRIGVVKRDQTFQTPKPLRQIGWYNAVQAFASSTSYFVFNITDSSKNYTMRVKHLGYHQPYPSPIAIQLGISKEKLPVSAETADFFSFDNVVHMDNPDVGTYYVGVFGYLAEPFGFLSPVENPEYTKYPLLAAIVLETEDAKGCNEVGRPELTPDYNDIVCSCPTNYVGDNCQAKCPSSNSTLEVCNNHGQCKLTNQNTAVCVCNNGWLGPDCNIPCSRATCNGHGTCVPFNSETFCICDREYIGPYCTAQCPTSDPSGLPCNQHGTCQYNATSGSSYCSCFAGWSGEACTVAETSVPDWISLTISKAVIGVIIALLVIVIVLLVLAITWKRKLSKTMNNYQPLNIGYN